MWQAGKKQYLLDSRTYAIDGGYDCPGSAIDDAAGRCIKKYTFTVTAPVGYNFTDFTITATPVAWQQAGGLINLTLDIRATRLRQQVVAFIK